MAVAFYHRRGNEALEGLKIVIGPNVSITEGGGQAFKCNLDH